MDLSAWAFGLDDLPAAFDGFSDGLKRVARPIYNSNLRRMSPASAVAKTLEDIAARGIEQDGQAVFSHEE